MRKLNNRFRELLAIKSRREGRTISQREVAEVTGIAKTTVDRYARNEQTQYHEHVVVGLCDYLDVPVSEFFVIEEVEDEEGQIKSALVA